MSDSFCRSTCYCNSKQVNSIVMMLFYGSYVKFFRLVDNDRHTYPRIVSYFPYANCFTQETDAQREYYYNEVGR